MKTILTIICIVIGLSILLTTDSVPMMFLAGIILLFGFAPLFTILLALSMGLIFFIMSGV